MPSKIHSIVLRSPGLKGLITEDEQVQAQPEYARISENISYDRSGRITNRKGFQPTNSLLETALGSDPIIPTTVKKSCCS